MKIAIIGYSGSGKSTLAKRLAHAEGCTALHLDAVHFAPNWQSRDIEHICADIDAVLQQENWVIEGNYTNFRYEARMEQAQQILFLNFPRRICLPRAYRRFLHYRGKRRPDMAEGCIEKFDWEFFAWIMWNGRNKRKRAEVAALKRKYPEKFIEFRHPRELNVYLTQRENQN